MASGTYPLTARDCQRRTAWLAVAALLVVAITTTLGWRGNHHPGSAASTTAPVSATGHKAGPAARPAAAGRMTTGRASLTAPSASQLAATSAARPLATPAARSLATPAARPVLTPAARRSCPPAAAACVDLASQLTWLQSDGTITYGPVRMEPGPPGTSHATPRGTFHVGWKAGADYVSTEYHEPMPYAVFFGPGGIAFHGGSLSTPSHGCVHLNINSARYYNDHLPVGAEVVVF
jgi:L,D-transpeptidase catalytic domain